MKLLLAFLLLSLLVQPLAAGPCASMQQESGATMSELHHANMDMADDMPADGDLMHDCCDSMPEGQVDCSSSQACSLLYLVAAPLHVTLAVRSSALLQLRLPQPPVQAPSPLLRPPIA